MPAMTAGQKARKVLEFLMGLGNPRAMSPLSKVGFGPADREEGWRLLKATSEVAFNSTAGGPVSPKIVKQIDDWENQWFVIIEATLARRFPEVREKVFLNLSQTEGPPVVLSVGTLVSRINALTAEGATAREREARALLASRGVNDLAMAEITSLLAAAEQSTEEPPNLDDLAEQRAVNEAAMWAWYIEWSRIARQTIANRQVLRGLGFLVRKSGAVEEEEEEVVAEPQPAPAPSPAPAPRPGLQPQPLGPTD
ncbi:MAG: hypothetical protein HOV80_15620 [Polyangiaceae bacterium]|nr:hypothetical protein [Polyangiaceae bacterium]